MKRLVLVLLFVATMLASLATNAGCLDSQRDESAPLVKRVLGSGQHEEDEDRRVSSKPVPSREGMAHEEQHVRAIAREHARLLRSRYQKAALELKKQRGSDQESHGGQEIKREGDEDNDDDGSIAYWLDRYIKVSEELDRTSGRSRKREREHEEKEERRQDLARLMPPPAGVPNAQRFRNLTLITQTPEREKKKKQQQPTTHPDVQRHVYTHGPHHYWGSETSYSANPEPSDLHLDLHRPRRKASVEARRSISKAVKGSDSSSDEEAGPEAPGQNDDFDLSNSVDLSGSGAWDVYDAMSVNQRALVHTQMQRITKKIEERKAEKPGRKTGRPPTIDTWDPERLQWVEDLLRWAYFHNTTYYNGNIKLFKIVRDYYRARWALESAVPTHFDHSTMNRGLRDHRTKAKASAEGAWSSPQHKPFDGSDESDESGESAPMVKRTLGSGQHEEEEDRPGSSKPVPSKAGMALEEQYLRGIVRENIEFWRALYDKTALELSQRVNQGSYQGPEMKLESDGGDEESLSYWVNRQQKVWQRLYGTPGKQWEPEHEHEREHEDKTRQHLAHLMPPPADVPVVQRSKRFNSMTQTQEREKSKQPKAYSNAQGLTYLRGPPHHRSFEASHSAERELSEQPLDLHRPRRKASLKARETIDKVTRIIGSSSDEKTGHGVPTHDANYRGSGVKEYKDMNTDDRLYVHKQLQKIIRQIEERKRGTPRPPAVHTRELIDTWDQSKLQWMEGFFKWAKEHNKIYFDGNIKFFRKVRDYYDRRWAAESALPTQAINKGKRKQPRTHPQVQRHAYTQGQHHRWGFEASHSAKPEPSEQALDPHRPKTKASRTHIKANSSAVLNIDESSDEGAGLEAPARDSEGDTSNISWKEENAAMKEVDRWTIRRQMLTIQEQLSDRGIQGPRKSVKPQYTQLIDLWNRNVLAWVGGLIKWARHRRWKFYKGNHELYERIKAYYDHRWATEIAEPHKDGYLPIKRLRERLRARAVEERASHAHHEAQKELCWRQAGQREEDRMRQDFAHYMTPQAPAEDPQPFGTIDTVTRAMARGKRKQLTSYSNVQGPTHEQGPHHYWDCEAFRSVKPEPRDQSLDWHRPRRRKAYHKAINAIGTRVKGSASSSNEGEGQEAPALDDEVKTSSVSTDAEYAEMTVKERGGFRARMLTVERQIQERERGVPGNDATSCKKQTIDLWNREMVQWLGGLFKWTRRHRPHYYNGNFGLYEKIAEYYHRLWATKNAEPTQCNEEEEENDENHTLIRLKQTLRDRVEARASGEHHNLPDESDPMWIKRTLEGERQADWQTLAKRAKIEEIKDSQQEHEEQGGQERGQGSRQAEESDRAQQLSPEWVEYTERTRAPQLHDLAKSRENQGALILPRVEEAEKAHEHKLKSHQDSTQKLAPAYAKNIGWHPSLGGPEKSGNTMPSNTQAEIQQRHTDAQAQQGHEDAEVESTIQAEPWSSPLDSQPSTQRRGIKRAAVRAKRPDEADDWTPSPRRGVKRKMSGKTESSASSLEWMPSTGHGKKRKASVKARQVVNEAVKSKKAKEPQTMTRKNWWNLVRRLRLMANTIKEIEGGKPEIIDSQSNIATWNERDLEDLERKFVWAKDREPIFYNSANLKLFEIIKRYVTRRLSQSAADDSGAPVAASERVEVASFYKKIRRALRQGRASAKRGFRRERIPTSFDDWYDDREKYKKLIVSVRNHHPSFFWNNHRRFEELEQLFQRREGAEAARENGAQDRANARATWKRKSRDRVDAEATGKEHPQDGAADAEAAQKSARVSALYQKSMDTQGQQHQWKSETVQTNQPELSRSFFDSKHSTKRRSQRKARVREGPLYESHGWRPLTWHDPKESASGNTEPSDSSLDWTPSTGRGKKREASVRARNAVRKTAGPLLESSDEDTDEATTSHLLSGPVYSKVEGAAPAPRDKGKMASGSKIPKEPQMMNYNDWSNLAQKLRTMVDQIKNRERVNSRALIYSWTQNDLDYTQRLFDWAEKHKRAFHEKNLPDFNFVKRFVEWRLARPEGEDYLAAWFAENPQTSEETTRESTKGEREDWDSTNSIDLDSRGNVQHQHNMMKKLRSAQEQAEALERGEPESQRNISYRNWKSEDTKWFEDFFAHAKGRHQMSYNNNFHIFNKLKKHLKEKAEEEAARQKKNSQDWADAEAAQRGKKRKASVETGNAVIETADEIDQATISHVLERIALSAPKAASDTPKEPQRMYSRDWVKLGQDLRQMELQIMGLLSGEEETVESGPLTLIWTGRGIKDMQRKLDWAEKHKPEFYRENIRHLEFVKKHVGKNPSQSEVDHLGTGTAASAQTNSKPSSRAASTSETAPPTHSAKAERKGLDDLHIYSKMKVQDQDNYMRKLEAVLEQAKALNRGSILSRNCTLLKNWTSKDRKWCEGYFRYAEKHRPISYKNHVNEYHELEELLELLEKRGEADAARKETLQNMGDADVLGKEHTQDGAVDAEAAQRGKKRKASDRARVAARKKAARLTESSDEDTYQATSSHYSDGLAPSETDEEMPAQYDNRAGASGRKKKQEQQEMANVDWKHLAQLLQSMSGQIYRLKGGTKKQIRPMAYINTWNQKNLKDLQGKFDWAKEHGLHFYNKDNIKNFEIVKKHIKRRLSDAQLADSEQEGHGGEHDSDRTFGTTEQTVFYRKLKSALDQGNAFARGAPRRSRTCNSFDDWYHNRDVYRELLKRSKEYNRKSWENHHRDFKELDDLFRRRAESKATQDRVDAGAMPAQPVWRKGACMSEQQKDLRKMDRRDWSHLGETLQRMATHVRQVKAGEKIRKSTMIYTWDHENIERVQRIFDWAKKHKPKAKFCEKHGKNFEIVKQFVEWRLSHPTFDFLGAQSEDEAQTDQEATPGLASASEEAAPEHSTEGESEDPDSTMKYSTLHSEMRKLRLAVQHGEAYLRGKRFKLPTSFDTWTPDDTAWYEEYFAFASEHRKKSFRNNYKLFLRLKWLLKKRAEDEAAKKIAQDRADAEAVWEEEEQPRDRAVDAEPAQTSGRATTGMLRPRVNPARARTP